MAKSIPEKIRDQGIRNQVDLERFSESLKRKMVKLLDDTRDEIIGELAKADLPDMAMSQWRKQRLQNLLTRIDEILKTQYGTLESGMQTEMKKLAKQQMRAVPEQLNAALGASIFGEVTISEEFLQALVTKTSIDGHLIGTWWKRAEDATRKRLKPIIEQGLQSVAMAELKGEAIQSIVSRLRGTANQLGIMSFSKKEAMALVRTQIMSVAANARMQVYRANEDILKGFQVIATLDTRTTSLCRALDHKEYNLNLQPVGDAPPLPAGPPFHWNCRSTLIPTTKTYAELLPKNSGLTKSQRSKLQEIPPSLRASIRGPVKGDMNYNDWLKTQDEETQIEVLGEVRHKLWKQNKLAMSDLIHQNRRPLTIEELEAKYDKARKKK